MSLTLSVDIVMNGRSDRGASIDFGGPLTLGFIPP